MSASAPAKKRVYRRKPAVSTSLQYATSKDRRYRQRQRYISGKGAYYFKGGLTGSAKIPGIGHAGAHLEGGYTSGYSQMPHIKGLGEYRLANIRRNIFMSDPPVIRNSRYKEGATVVRHREYLGQIISSSTANTFKIQTFPLNPAQSQTFPWLASIAANYEEYSPNGVVFEFKSTCSDAIASSTNLALGSVLLATQYDPLDATFQSDIEMLNYEFAQSCKVSDSVCHFIECDPKQTPLSHLYTRPGAPINNSDLRFSDLGTFSIASYGLQGTSVVLGQLWVTYEFLLYKPKVSLISPVTGNIYKTYASGLTQATPFGSSWANSPNNDLQCSVTSTVITLPLTAQPASYLISINASGFTAMAAAYNAYTFSNCQRIRCWGGGAATADVAPQAGLAGTTSTSYVMVVTVNNAVSAAPTITSATTAATLGGNVDILITQLAYFDPSIYGTG